MDFSDTWYSRSAVNRAQNFSLVGGPWGYIQIYIYIYIYIYIIYVLLAPGLENRRLTAVGTRCADHVTPLYPQKLALTSPTGGGRPVGIVRSRTKTTEFSLVYV